ncbi:stabilizer of axonemal microtubules 3-like [Dysidea avara]|uniref:stabilizer of axonemal microtubules 3-like n=1 Tax=Dysidea avara TaxID=196820 RepID=UPI0033297C1B
MEFPRNDLHLTTTGVGHAFRNQLPFPPTDIELATTKQLPERLVAPSSNPLTVQDVYDTTYSVTHDYKPKGTIVDGPEYKKAAGHWNVSYLANHVNKLNEKPYRQPLTMGQQTSEMRDQYYDKTDQEQYQSDMGGVVSNVDTLLADHHQQGPTKEMIASTQNDALRRRPVLPEEHAVLTLNDPYLSVTQKDHRRFTKNELDKYPKKDIATYWQCEDYPKSWGHGMDKNPLPKPMATWSQEPMRDRMVFPTGTNVSTDHQPIPQVPNSGMCSLCASSYTEPTQEQRQQLFVSPLKTVHQQSSGPGKADHNAVPNMYQTINSSYGKGAATVCS